MAARPYKYLPREGGGLVSLLPAHIPQRAAATVAYSAAEDSIVAGGALVLRY